MYDLEPDLESDHVVFLKTIYLKSYQFLMKICLKGVISSNYISEASWVMTMSYDN